MLNRFTLLPFVLYNKSHVLYYYFPFTCFLTDEALERGGIICLLFILLFEFIDEVFYQYW